MKNTIKTYKMMRYLPKYYEDTIDDFLKQGDKVPTPEEFIMNCYDKGMFGDEELSTWFEDPKDPSDEEMQEFIDDSVDYFHLYKVLSTKEEAARLRNEVNSREAILKKELNKIYRKLEMDYISNDERDYLEDKKDHILEQLGVSKNIKDSINFDYDFDQVMYAVYEGEYDGELGQFDLPRFEKTEELIQKLWDEKYNDVESWFEIPWTKEEKDMIFESGRNEAKMLDRIDIYNSRARYQSYDETRRILKEVFGIDNKYLNDSKYNSCSNNKKEKGNKIRKDSLDKRQRNILAKHILNCYSDKGLLDIIYELIDWDNKLFDKAMDIYEENGSVQYKAKKISDLLIEDNTSLKDDFEKNRFIKN